MLKMSIILVIILSLPIFASDELQLSDLGLSKEDTSSNLDLEKKLEKRRTMLKYHQHFALAALASMTASILTGGEGSNVSETHEILGITSGTLYLTAASLALAAPKINGEEVSPNLKWHKRLAWIHAPALIIGPILGLIAKKRYEQGKTVDGVLKLHPPLVAIGYLTFATSAALMTFEF